VFNTSQGNQFYRQQKPSVNHSEAWHFEYLKYNIADNCCFKSRFRSRHFLSQIRGVYAVFIDWRAMRFAVKKILWNVLETNDRWVKVRWISEKQWLIASLPVDEDTQDSIAISVHFCLSAFPTPRVIAGLSPPLRVIPLEYGIHRCVWCTKTIESLGYCVALFAWWYV